MRPPGVIVGDRSSDDLSSLVEIKEQALVEQFVAHSPVGGFDIAVLHLLAGSDVVPLDPMLFAPAQDRIRVGPDSRVRTGHEPRQNFVGKSESRVRRSGFARILCPWIGVWVFCYAAACLRDMLINLNAFGPFSTTFLLS
jgi:hypothetical protein